MVRAFALLLLTASLSLAELPPYVYQAEQAGAPEALELKIISVRHRTTKDGEDTRSAVTVRARVEKVERSKTQLKAGDEIVVAYERTDRARPMPGPSEIPLLRKGQSVPAYLSGETKSGIYAPAAGGKSFTRMR